MSDLRILVVDDEPDVELLLRQKFRHEIRNGELEFAFARDGKEALEILEADSGFSLVLSDINMPRMDGLTFLGQMTERFSDLNVVVVSAYGDLRNIRTAMNLGAFDFITKPIEFPDLDATIQKAVRNSQALSELRHAKSEAEMARATLAKYFSPSVVSLVSQNSAGLPVGGDRREATFLFTDLTDFTPLVETTDPDVVVTLLNGYLDGLARIIFSHEGTLMKIVGDACQAAFGAPVEQDDHAERAVRCALEIDEFSEKYRQEWSERGVELGATRIGINTGFAIIGNFGGETFFEYTAYGSAVNIASRFEAANKTLGTRICVGKSVVDRISDFQGRPSGDLILAGHAGKTRAFEALQLQDAENPAIASYREAFEKMEAGDPGARQAFAALMAELPDDPLTQLHLQRALGGARDVTVDASRK